MSTPVAVRRWCSHLTNACEVAPATTSLPLALRCTVVGLGAWDKQADRQTNGRIAELLNVPYRIGDEHNEVVDNNSVLTFRLVRP